MSGLSWLSSYDQQYKNYLNVLIDNNYIHSYPPLCIDTGAYTAQYEHTIYISENKKIVFSNSNDY